MDSKNSSDLDMGRRPELKSDEFFESTPISSRDNLTFVFETAETSDSVIGNLTQQRHILYAMAHGQLSPFSQPLKRSNHA